MPSCIDGDGGSQRRKLPLKTIKHCRAAEKPTGQGTIRAGASPASSGIRWRHVTSNTAHHHERHLRDRLEVLALHADREAHVALAGAAVGRVDEEVTRNEIHQPGEDYEEACRDEVRGLEQEGHHKEEPSAHA